MSSISVFDLSHHNDPHVVDMHAAYAAGFILMMQKASQGTSYVDSSFASHTERWATIEGSMQGGYHFGDASDATAQAKHALYVHGDHRLLCLDFERNFGPGGSMNLEQAEEFVTVVKDAMGIWPMLYGGELLKANPIPTDSVLFNCELWLSEYGPEARLPLGWDHYRFWQFTDGNVGPSPHEVPGIGRCDISRFNGSPDELRAWYASLAA